MTETYLTEKTSRPRQAWLLLAPLILWSLYHFGAYLLVEAACRTGLLAGQILGLRSLNFVVILLTLAALLGHLYLGRVTWRRMRTGESDEYGSRFLGMVGFWFNLLLALVVLADGVSILVLGSCG